MSRSSPLLPYVRQPCRPILWVLVLSLSRPFVRPPLDRVSSPHTAVFLAIMLDHKDGHSSADKLSSSDVALASNSQPPPRRDVWFRLDLFLLPVVTVIFFLSFLVSHPCLSTPLVLTKPLAPIGQRKHRQCTRRGPAARAQNHKLPGEPTFFPHIVRGVVLMEMRLKVQYSFDCDIYVGPVSLDGTRHLTISG